VLLPPSSGRLEAASTPETSVNFYQTTRSYNPEDINLHNRHRENLKSHLAICGEIYLKVTEHTVLMTINLQLGILLLPPVLNGSAINMNSLQDG
jgi:hypothetical protein